MRGGHSWFRVDITRSFPHRQECPPLPENADAGGATSEAPSPGSSSRAAVALFSLERRRNASFDPPGRSPPFLSTLSTPDPAAPSRRRRLSSHGCFPIAFMALRFSVACRGVWPPERKTMPGTAGGTTRERVRTVASATCAAPAWTGHPFLKRPCWASAAYPRGPRGAPSTPRRPAKALRWSPLRTADRVVPVHQHSGSSMGTRPASWHSARIGQRMGVGLDAVTRRESCPMSITARDFAKRAPSA